MSLPDFYLPRKGATIAASLGRDHLCRIRDAMVSARDQGALPALVAISDDVHSAICAFWTSHFPETAARDLPMGMFGVSFVVRNLGGAPFAFGYNKPETQHLCRLRNRY